MVLRVVNRRGDFATTTDKNLIRHGLVYHCVSQRRKIRATTNSFPDSIHKWLFWNKLEMKELWHRARVK
jgi:hypothetical protein